MKILFYINTIDHGGAERVMVNLANALSGRGHSVVLVTSFATKREYSYNSAVKRINLASERIAGKFKRNYIFIRELRRVIKDEKPDIAVSFMSQPNFRTLAATIGLKTKTLISVRNDPKVSYPDKISRILAKTFYRFADAIVFQTEEAKEWFPKAIQKKSRIIMNQVDDKFFTTTHIGERRDIIATGRLTHQKNHHMLIDAFSLIADKVKDNLIIYGEGDLRAELEEYISQKGLAERVQLPGITNDVPNTIKGARLYAMSSDYEGMPNALIEAMALGLPCVATDCPCGGPRVLLGGLKGKYLVDVGNAEQMAESMLTLLTMSADEYNEARAEIKERAEMCRGDKVIIDWEQFIGEIFEKN